MYQEKDAAIPIRLSRFLAQSGVCSRRHADELIEQGKVLVNGRTAVLGEKVIPSKDDVRVEGLRVSGKEPCIYIMLNKPSGYLSSCSDPQGRPTVLSLVPEVKERVFPVGRLDQDADGLVLLTNDGTLAYLLTHPRYEVTKEYIVEFSGVPKKGDLNRLLSGILIGGRMVYPDYARFMKPQGDSRRILIAVHEGQKHLVKELCLALGYDVRRLTRTRIGSLSLAGLDQGKWRYLNPKEVHDLYKTARAGQEGEHHVRKRKDQVPHSR